MKKKSLMLIPIILLLLAGVTLAIVLPLTLGKEKQPQEPEPKTVSVTITQEFSASGNGTYMEGYKWFTKNGETVIEKDYGEEGYGLSTMTFTAKAGDKVIFGLYLKIYDDDDYGTNGLENIEYDENSIGLKYGIYENSYSSGTVSEDDFKQAILDTDIWSIDKYMALHWGWPFDVAEKGGNTFSRSKVDDVFDYTKAAY